MSENYRNKCLHFAMYPWFAFGHLNSFLHLANKLAQRGHKVSFFLPTKAQAKLSPHNHHPNLITFIPITVPPVDGLPAGAETTNDVPASARPRLLEAMNLTQPDIDLQLAHLKPDFIFFDFTEWLPSVARKHSIKSIYYKTIYVISVAYFSKKADDNLPSNYQYKGADLVDPAPGFPSSAIRLKAHEAREMARLLEVDFGGMTLVKRHSICFEECDVVGLKTCRELEGVYCEFVQKQWTKPVLLTGPAVPEPPSSKLDDFFDGWLSGFDHGKVVFCAFGSECVLQKNQFQELVLGLELTGRPFLAALRPPRGCETIEEALPTGYLERIKGRGIIHGGWVQQQLILHHPSIGCFVTHCGTGSLSEAMSSECQLVLIPQAGDQFLNARLMSMDLKVGIEVEKGEDDGFFTKEAVFKAIEEVMNEESTLGKEVRANHTTWRNILLTEGLEESYIDEFIQRLQDML